MKAKLKEKRIVQKLRQQGLSYGEILQKVLVAKGSVSLWCKDIKLSPKQKDRLDKKRKENLQRIIGLGAKTVAQKRKREIRKIKTEAKKEIQHLSLYEAKVVGAMLYWAEGNKNSRAEITNSDPKLIKLMIRWFEEACGVPPERLKARLNIHANQDDRKIKKYWSRITRIPLKRFNKSYIKPEGTGHRKNILHNGVIKVGVGSEDLRHRIMTWIKALC